MNTNIKCKSNYLWRYIYIYIWKSQSLLSPVILPVVHSSVQYCTVYFGQHFLHGCLMVDRNRHNSLGRHWTFIKKVACCSSLYFLQANRYSTSMLDHWIQDRRWLSSPLEYLRDKCPVGHYCPSDYKKCQSILKNVVWDKCNQYTSRCMKDVLSFPDARTSSGTVPVSLFSRNQTVSFISVKNQVPWER